MSVSSFEQNTRKTPANYIGASGLVVSDNHALGRTWFEIQRPFRPVFGIVLRVTDGYAKYMVNLVSYELKNGDLLQFPENSIFEVLQVSDDLKVQFFSYSDIDDSFTRTQHYIHIADELCWNRFSTYFSLLDQLLRADNPHAAQHIRIAAIQEIKHMYDAGDNKTEKLSGNRQQIVFKRFSSLLMEFAHAEHYIQFYADKLNLSPNRLSAIIKAESGMTAQDWISTAVIQQACIYLIHSDLAAFEIADRLHFHSPETFSRYFKRETGMTPLAYRKKNQ